MVKTTGRPNQRNNSTIINKNTRESPTNALKCATNSQIKADPQLVQQRQKDKTSKYRAKNAKHLSLFRYLFDDPTKQFESSRAQNLLSKNQFNPTVNKSAVAI